MLSTLYQEKMVTEQDLEGLRSAADRLWYCLLHIQCRKPPKVVTRTAELLDEVGRNKEASQLIGQWMYSCFISSCNYYVAFCHDNEHMQFAAVWTASKVCDVHCKKSYLQDCHH